MSSIERVTVLGEVMPGGRVAWHSAFEGAVTGPMVMVDMVGMRIADEVRQ
jgi:hypothetical protein